MPNEFRLSVVAGLYGTNRWFTEGHIEVCGDDSVCLTFMGQKFFIYAAGVKESKHLIATTKTVESFMDLAHSGPPSGWEGKFSVCIPEQNSLIAKNY